MEKHRKNLQRFIDLELKDKNQIKVLEAGCGSRNNFNFPAEKVHFTGIDISEKQLNRNKNLDIKIQGDLQKYDLGTEIYDAVICWNVLEHLNKPQNAIKNILSSIKKDGLIIIGIPNVLSIKGLTTKFLPHKLHVYFYRYIMGRKDAGKDDVGPFKTYLRFSISKDNLETFAKKNNAELAYFDKWDASDLDYYLNKNLFSKIIKLIYRVLMRSVHFLTLGSISKSELIFVIKKI